MLGSFISKETQRLRILAGFVSRDRKYMFNKTRSAYGVYVLPHISG